MQPSGQAATAHPKKQYHTHMRQAIVCAVLMLAVSAFALSQEGDATGPNFSGDYVLIRATGALRGAAPKQLHIVQTERLFRVGVADGHGIPKWMSFPLKTDWVEDDGNGKVKAYFSYGGLDTERAIKLRYGYFNELDRWTFLGKSTIKLCKDAYARKSFWDELEKSGCAEYSRRVTAAPRP